MENSQQILDLPDWIKPYREALERAKVENTSSSARVKPGVVTRANFQKKYTYCKEFYEIGLHCENLLLRADEGTLVLGFDADWPSDYKSVFKTKQIHICSGDKECAIINLSGVNKIPKALTLLLKHSNVCLVGYDICRDLTKFGKDFNVTVDEIIAKLEDPKKYVEHELSCLHDWSIESVAEKALNPLEDAEQAPKPEVLTFRGLVNFTNTTNNIGIVCEQLLHVVDLFPGDQNLVFGFDLEWPFTYKPGAGHSGKVALIQMCADERACFLFHVASLKSLPKALVLLLNHRHVKLTGLNIANDIRKLGHDFKIDVTGILQNRIIELCSLANNKLNTRERWSLDRLVLNQLNVVLPKPKNVRISNWAQPKLTTQQIKYAAADAYASLAVYNHLMDTISPNLLALLN